MKIDSLLLPGLTALLFSGSYIAARLTTVDLPPFTTSFLRYVIALTFLGCTLLKGKRPSLHIHRRDRVWFFLAGLTGIVGYHTFFLLSLRYTQVANTAIINATGPVLTGILAAIFLKERLSYRNYLGVGLAFAGVLVLLAGGHPANLIMLKINPGDALMLLAVVSWVFYGLIAKQLTADYSGFTIVFYATTVGTVLLFFLSLTETPLSALQSTAAAGWFSVAYMGIFASGIGYLLYTMSLRQIGPTRTSSIVYSLVPLLVALWAHVFFAQPVTVPMAAGMLCIGTGLQLIIKGKR